MNTAGTYHYPPCAGTGNLLLANPLLIFNSMDTNQPTTAEVLPVLTVEEFAQLSQKAGGSALFEACNYDYAFRIAKRAYTKGADAELKAYSRTLRRVGINVLTINAICDARRPKPPTLKEQAPAILDDCNLDAAHENTIRRALEALPE